MFFRRIHLGALVILCLCVFFITPAAFSATAFASTDPIRVISRSDTIDFPQYIDFQVSAYDISSNITQALISITFNASNYPQQHSMTISRPARNVTARWREETGNSSGFQPPGTHITYYWLLRDSAGHEHTDTTQHFTT